MCEKYLYGSEGGAGHDRPYPYLRTNKKTRSHRNGAAGWSARRNVSECVFNTFAELTTPAASLRNGNFLLMSRPPLLFKEGKKPNTHFPSSKMANLQTRAKARDYIGSAAWA